MIRPAAFGYNAETAISNHYQQAAAATATVQELALAEFDAFVDLLRQQDIAVDVQADDSSVQRPDALFPNNWFSTHAGGTLVLYPMEAPNRRAERRAELIAYLCRTYGYHTIYDLTHHENEGRFLEGTGSILFDPQNGLAWAAFSSRTSADALLDVCERLHCLPVVVATNDGNNRPVYHTNVLLALQERLAIVCLDVIADATDRSTIERMLKRTGRELLCISRAQMEAFAGNALFVKNRSGADFVVLSHSGWSALNPAQQHQLSAVATPVTPHLHTIETVGGGSARCMLAELF